MFTGLVETVGRVLVAEERTHGRKITIDAPVLAPALSIGDSVAIDGVCLTVIAQNSTSFGVEVVAPTLERTTAGEWSPGRALNLERALRADARLGGHFVQGHVDGVGAVAQVRRAGEHVLLEVELPEVVAEVTVLHGSIAIDGVSLTISEMPAGNRVRVALIPHTWSHTNLQRLAERDRVNLEGDLIGRFVVQYLKRIKVPWPRGID